MKEGDDVGVYKGEKKKKKRKDDVETGPLV